MHRQLSLDNLETWWFPGRFWKVKVSSRLVISKFIAVNLWWKLDVMTSSDCAHIFRFGVTYTVSVCSALTELWLRGEVVYGPSFPPLAVSHRRAEVSNCRPSWWVVWISGSNLHNCLPVDFQTQTCNFHIRTFPVPFFNQSLCSLFVF